MYKRILLFFLLTHSLHSYSQKLLKDIASSDASSNITINYTNINYAIKGDTLFFLAEDTTYRNNFYKNIWFTNGTATNTKKITNAFQNNHQFSYKILASLNGKVYYHYERNADLYVTDGNVNSIVKSFQNSDILKTTSLNGWLYVFVDNNATNTLELWKTNGTSANTSKVTDVYQGSHYFPNYNFLSTGNKTYFSLSTGNFGDEPWITDGTAIGTKILKDIEPGSAGSYANSFNEVGNTVMFFSRNPNASQKLWKTDGTEAGTVRIDNESYGPRFRITYNNHLCFDTYSGTFYKSDGNSVSLANINLEIYDGLVNFNNLMYYIRRNENDFELWKSDGTQAGTTKVKTLISSPVSISPSIRIVTGASKLYIQLSNYSNDSFTNITQHWVSNGTAEGTVNINSLNPNFSTGSSTNQLVVVGDTYYFSAYDATNGFELWKSDGTIGGTHLVKNINKGAASSDPAQFIALNNNVFFIADDIKHGREIWKTDGTAANTRLLIDYNQGPSINMNYSSYISEMIAYNDTIIAQISRQLVKFNHNVPPTPFYSTTLLNPKNPEFTKFANKIFFKGYDSDNGGYELYVTNGNTVTKVKDLSTNWNGADPSNLLVWNGLLYFSTDNNTKIWKTDGTDAGTVLVKDFSAGSIQSKFYEVNGLLMFTFESPTYGLELWRTDGTEAGTFLVKDINPGSGASYIYNLIVYNNRLFFNAYNGSGYSLFKSDGTNANTNVFSNKLSIGVPNVANNKLFFINYDTATNKYWLCATDGITAPVNIKQIGDYTTINAHNTLLMNVGNNLLVFDIMPTTSRHELWASDGTITGTKIVKVIREKESIDNFLNIKEYLYHNNKLYFAANDGINGTELWVWDFTCPEFMTLNNSISQDSVFTVDKYIVGNNKINAGVKVEYNANKYVTLSPGFETKAGSRFTASMNGCINLAQSANTISSTNEPIFKNHTTKTDNLPSIVHFLHSPLNAELLSVYLAEIDKGNEQNIAWIIDETTDKYILKMRVNEKEYVGYLPK